MNATLCMKTVLQGRACTLSMAVFLLFSAGCSMLQTPPDAAEADGLGANGGQSGPTFIVDIKPVNRPVESFTRPLVGDIWLQDVLRESGAIKRFRRMNIDLVRVGPDGKQAKMKAEYNRRKRQISFETDYAIRAGDHVMIVEDNTSIFDDMLSSALGPFGGIAR